MTKIIFFDGDGTLWYPKSTKHTKKPHWIYEGAPRDDYKNHLVLTPHVKETLRVLRKQGIATVLISTHPHKKAEADALLREKVHHFGLEPLFDEVHTARNVVTGKGEVILRVLKRLGYPKSSALMVGDSYRWDYLAAKRVGVEGVLMDTPYLKELAQTYPGAGRVKRTLRSLREVVNYLTE